MTTEIVPAAGGVASAATRPPVIAVFNHKGGVAKTTTACNLAVCLAAHGLKALLVDLDSQGNATTGFGHAPLPPKGSSEVLTGRARLAETVLGTGFKGLSLVPASIGLRDADLDLGAGPSSRSRLAAAFAEGGLGQQADVVVIDCPPAFGPVTVNALAAATAALIPARPDAFSHEGLTNTWYELKRIRESVNADLGIAGILLVMTGADQAGRDSAQAIRAEFGEPVLATSIPVAASVSEAAALSLPVAVLEPDGEAGGAYFEATREIIARLERQTRAGTRLPSPAGRDEALNTLREWRAAQIALRRLPGGRGWAKSFTDAEEPGQGEEGTPAAPPPSWRAFALGFAAGALVASLVALAI